MTTENDTKLHTNPDAITGAPASHPGATAIGTASGTTAGALIGMVGGPVGIAVGGIVGGIVGAAIGHGAGEWHDPSDQDYWRSEYKNRPYYDQTSDFDQDLAPAYRYGSNAGFQSAGMQTGTVAPTGDFKGFNAIEETARKDWDTVKAKSKLSYEQARAAISDAYNRKSPPRQPISDRDNIAH